MTYQHVIYAIIVGAAVNAGCQREVAAPAPPHANGGSGEKVRIQLNLGKQGSVDVEKSDKSSN